MRFLLPVLLSFIATIGILSAGESQQKSPPNPAKSDFPTYWDAKSWDTEEGAAFWTAKVPRKTSKSSPGEPVSQSPQPNDFLDRQSEK